jgi:hypothetical protein
MAIPPNPRPHGRGFVPAAGDQDQGRAELRLARYRAKLMRHDGAVRALVASRVTGLRATPSRGSAGSAPRGTRAR